MVPETWGQPMGPPSSTGLCWEVGLSQITAQEGNPQQMSVLLNRRHERLFPKMPAPPTLSVPKQRGKTPGMGGSSTDLHSHPRFFAEYIPLECRVEPPENGRNPTSRGKTCQETTNATIPGHSQHWKHSYSSAPWERVLDINLLIERPEEASSIQTPNNSSV